MAEEIEPILTDLFTGRERVDRARPPAAPPAGRAADGARGSRAAHHQRSAHQQDHPLRHRRRTSTRSRRSSHNLDVPIYVPNDRVHVVRLKNLEAEDTAEVLSTLIEAASIFGTARPATRAPARRARARARTAPGPSNPREEEKPAVVADVKSNSLIIAATKRQFEELERRDRRDRHQEGPGADRGGPHRADPRRLLPPRRRARAGRRRRRS